MKDRNITLDLVRIIAMIMVIFLHASFADKDVSSYGYILGGINFLFQPAVPLFLMLSGSLLLPTKYSAQSFLKKRLGKVIIPTLVWSIIYLLFRSPSLSEFLHSVISIPFSSQGHPIMWYMYVLIGLYLLTPILSCWIRNSSKKEIEFYLILWLISLSLPYIGLIAETNHSVSGILYYFNGYVGYFIGGYYFLHNIKTIKADILIVTACIIWLTVIALRLTNIIDEEVGALFGNLSSLGAIINFAWFVGLYKLFTKFKIHNFSERTKSIMINLSNLTFGVYLTHIIIYRSIVWPYIVTVAESYPLKLFIGAISCCVFTFVFCHLISLFPYAQYIIGIKQIKPQSTDMLHGGGKHTDK